VGRVFDFERSIGEGFALRARRFRSCETLFLQNLFEQMGAKKREMKELMH